MKHLPIRPSRSTLVSACAVAGFLLAALTHPLPVMAQAGGGSDSSAMDLLPDHTFQEYDPRDIERRFTLDSDTYRREVESDDAQAPPRTGSTDDPLAQGTWIATAYGGGSFEFNTDSDESFGYGSIGVGYHVVDDFSINLEANFYQWDQSPGGDPAAGGLNLLGRWHFYKHDRFAMHLEGSGGFLIGEDDLVEEGSSDFQFILGAGLGATYQINEDLLLMGGVRYNHVSNANLSDENPGFDGVGGYFGVMIPF